MNLFHSKITNLLFLVVAAISMIACGGGGGGNQTADPPQPEESEWLIPTGQIADGGPGPDGIPALNEPVFDTAENSVVVNPNDLVIAVRYDGIIEVFPHDIMDWHEIVNSGTEDNPYTLSYCPLTGSAVAWKGNAGHADSTFGVSGLLFNSNLLLYDRETRSLWSQMYEISVNGSRIREVPERIQVIETKFSTLLEMYPDADMLTRATGFIRDYGSYPYGEYRTNSGILFPVSTVDIRLHPKMRIIGIRSGSGVSSETSKVYQIAGFGDQIQTINDHFDGSPIVVVGSTALNFAAIYSRELGDGTILAFSPLDDQLPNIMTDDEGNVWDVFGAAVTGPRAGEQLQQTNSYTSFWFAWVAHFPEPGIHFNIGQQ